MGDEAVRKLTSTTRTAASSIADLAAERAAKAANYTSNSSYPVYQKYTPEQLAEKLVKSVKSSDLEGDELRALVGEIITSVTNQLYEIIKERES